MFSFLEVRSLQYRLDNNPLLLGFFSHITCKVGLSQGRYTWRQNRVLQKLAEVISMAKEQSTQPQADAVIFTTEGGAYSWHGTAIKSTNQRKYLLDGCDDWEVSADLPEWDSHPSIIKETRLRPDIVIHSSSTQQIIMVELTVPYGSRMEEAHTYKREKIPEPDQKAKRCRL